MKQITLNIPSMYADHHVLRVRDLLEELEGIGEVYASSAWKQLMISFEPDRIDQEGIEIALAEGGYSVGQGEPPILVERDRIGRDPRWAEISTRTTKTNPSDREMVRQFHQT